MYSTKQILSSMYHKTLFVAYLLLSTLGVQKKNTNLGYNWNFGAKSDHFKES